MANERMELKHLMKELSISGRKLGRWVRKHPNTISKQVTGKSPVDGAILELLRLAVRVKALMVVPK